MVVLLAALFALALVLLLWLWAIGPQLPQADFSAFHKYDYAHRGLHNREKGVPENSLMAFDLAARGGFGMELDVQLTQDGQVVVLNPGRTGGALEFLAVIRAKGCTKDIVVAETQTLIYSCRKVGDNAVEIYGVKKEVDLGAFPANRTQTVLDLLHPYYPQFAAAKNCLETSLSNIGALFHPTPVLLNIGRIENDKNGYRYYWDGITPSVAVLVKAIDQERMAVAQAYGVKVLSAEEWLRQSYDTYGDTLYELLQHNQAYADIKAPKTIDARYVTEDVPMSLVPISELGRIAGVPTPNIDSVITLTSTIYRKDFRKEGRCAENLGIQGMSKDQVAHYFETGVKA